MKNKELKKASGWVLSKWSEIKAAEIVMSDEPHKELARLLFDCKTGSCDTFEWKNKKYLISLHARTYTAVRKKVDDLCMYFTKKEIQQELEF